MTGRSTDHMPRKDHQRDRRPGIPEMGCVPCWAPPKRRSGRTDVLGLQAFLALHDVKLDLLALPQLTEALVSDVGVVGKDVGTAAVLLDESEALLAVEPLHGAGGHAAAPLLRSFQARDMRASSRRLDRQGAGRQCAIYLRPRSPASRPRE